MSKSAAIVWPRAMTLVREAVMLFSTKCEREILLRKASAEWNGGIEGGEGVVLG
jgi:hypothetical protein